MKRTLKRLLPFFMILLILGSMVWYFSVYDRELTQDILLSHARYFDERGNHNIAAWFYDLAYEQSNEDETVAIELAEKFKEAGNYTKAEYTLSSAIADGGSVELYIALCKTYVEQNKLLDAVTMLDSVADPAIKKQLDDLRPETPIAAQAPGFYSQYITVSIESNSGTLYISTDKEYPSTADEPYSAPVQLVGGENTIYALAVNERGLVSRLAVFGYVVGGVVEEVTLSDKAMDSMVRQLLNKGANDKLISSELWTITSITLPKEAVNLTDLQYLPYLRTLTVEKGQFSSLNGLSFLSSLTELTVRGSVLSSSDMASIAALPNLQKLTLEDCSLSSIANLAAAKKLTHLDLSGNMIRDLSVLAPMTTLEKLDLSRNAVTDLSQLAGLTALKELDVSYNSLASVMPLKGCESLLILNASNNAIGSLSGLEGIQALTQLNVAHNRLTEIGPLASSNAITVLDISHNTVLDLTPVGKLVNLTELNFANNEITSLPAFAPGTALVTVNGSNNKISSLDPLGGLQQLNNVLMENNKISSVDILANCHMLITVNVYGNPVKDVSKLTEMSVVVYYTPV